MREPQEVRMPRTQMLSLIAMGTPASGIDDLSGSMSMLSARNNAPSRSISRNAFSVSFNFSAAVREDSATDRAEISPAAISARSLDALGVISTGPFKPSRVHRHHAHVRSPSLAALEFR